MTTGIWCGFGTNFGYDILGFHFGTPLTVVTIFGLGLLSQILVWDFWCGIGVTDFGAGIIVTNFGVTNFDVFRCSPAWGKEELRGGAWRGGS